MKANHKIAFGSKGTVNEAISLRTAQTMFQQGELSKAHKLCQLILAQTHDHSAALHLMGLIAYQRQRYAEAEHYLSNAISHNRQCAAYHCDLGIVLMAKNEHQQAFNCFCHTVHLQPNHTLAHTNGGLALKALQRYEESRCWFQAALSIDPNFIDAHINLGLLHRDLQSFEAAISAFESALTIDPRNARVHFCLGDVYQAQRDMVAAIRHFQSAVSIKSDYVKAYNRLTQCLTESDRIDEAIFWMSKVVRIAPQHAESFCKYGNILRQAKLFPQSIRMYRKAIELNPEYAEAHYNLSIVLLLNGIFDQGWPEFEWRLRQFSADSGYPYRHGLPIWQGQPLRDKTILVYDEQRFGDVFLFIRFLPKLIAAGARLVVETRPALIQLLRQLPDIEEIVVRSRTDRPKTACDYCLPLASLPNRLAIDMDSIPADVPYIHPEPELVSQWAHRMSKGAFKIGLVWSGSNIDPKRRIDLGIIAPLAEFTDIGIYGLQKYPDVSHAPVIEDHPWLDNLGPELNDFSDTAAAIANCDLIITMDTAVAHLAGAMGQPVWVFLPHLPDWRWFLDREDSPWYPSMRLFRQNQAGQWTLPVCRMLVAVKHWINRHRGFSIFDTLPEQTDRTLAETLFRKAVAMQKKDEIDHAIDTYQKAIGADWTLMECHYNLGLLFYQQNRWSQAAECFRNALVLVPDNTHTAYNLALAYEKDNLTQAAIAAYQQALEIDSNYMEAAYNLGLLFFDQKKYIAAIEIFSKVVGKNRHHHEAYNNLGLAYHHVGRIDEAVHAFEAAIGIKTDYVEAYQNLGNVYMDLAQWDQMFFYYQKALEHNRQDPRAHHAMGKLYLEHFDMENAQHHFEQAIALAPDYADAHFDLATLFLRQGDYLKGWKEMRWRFKQSQSRIRVFPHLYDCPIWDGSKFEGRTLLVHCEQGFGDTIQFARFLPLVKSLGGQVVFQAQPALLPLFENIPGIDKLVALKDDPMDLSDIDLVLPLLSLPDCLHITMDKIPCQIPYLMAAPHKADFWQGRVDPKCFNVGIVWSGSPLHINDKRRSCPVKHFITLGDLPIHFYSLQKNVDHEELEQLRNGCHVEHWADQFLNFADTAAAISNLDLIITVDTAVAHLAGAMGRNVWIILPYLADWRWGMHGSKNIWYPTARLFRQHQDRSWETIFKNVRQALFHEVHRNRMGNSSK